MIPRIFLSYSSRDVNEVEGFDLELRRRGVPLWRDRSDLRAGRPSAVEIERALRDAAGFVVYLTENAACSEWVREREVTAARREAGRRPTFGIVPVFRGDLDGVSQRMIDLGATPRTADGSSIYDLRGYTGAVIDPDRARRGFLGQELAGAAGRVLACHLEGLAGSRGKAGGAPLRLGVVTRGASLDGRDLDLLLDGRPDFPAAGPLPTPAACDEHLLPALGALQAAVARFWPQQDLEIVPQCHLSLALALGFQFRRNTGASLEVREIHGDVLWPGPRVPLAAAPDRWSFRHQSLPGGGDDLAVAVGVSGPIVELVEAYLREEVRTASRLLVFEPANGPGRTSMQGIDPELPHRMSVAVSEKILEARKERPYRTVHLFYAGPPALAVLLAQQLSNVGSVQTYEWIDGLGRYQPSFCLRS